MCVAPAPSRGRRAGKHRKEMIGLLRSLQHAIIKAVRMTDPPFPASYLEDARAIISPFYAHYDRNTSVDQMSAMLHEHRQEVLGEREVSFSSKRQGAGSQKALLGSQKSLV